MAQSLMRRRPSLQLLREEQLEGDVNIVKLFVFFGRIVDLLVSDRYLTFFLTESSSRSSRESPAGYRRPRPGRPRRRHAAAGPPASRRVMIGPLRREAGAGAPTRSLLTSLSSEVFSSRGACKIDCGRGQVIQRIELDR